VSGRETHGSLLPGAAYGYQDVTLGGTITVNIPDHPSIKQEFHRSGRFSGPNFSGDYSSYSYVDDTKKDLQMLYWYKEPDYYRGNTLDKTFTEALSNVIIQLYGTNGLIAALHDKDENIKYLAIRGLANAKEKKAIGSLLTLVKGMKPWTLKEFEKMSRREQGRRLDNWDIETTVADALETISGQSFGRDYQTWMSWWENHKSEFSN